MLTSYQSLFLQFVEESWERELQGSVEPEEISEIINKRKEMLTPSVGEPFVFFEWFYNKGYELYIKYYQKHLPHIVYGPFLKEAALDESNLKWKITTIPSEEESQVEEEEIEYSVDLTGLFNEELNKIKAVYDSIYRELPDKKSFVSIVEDHINYFIENVKLDKITRSSYANNYILPIKKLHYQIHNTLVNHLNKKLKKWNLNLPYHAYPVFDENYNASDPTVGFKFEGNLYRQKAEQLYSILIAAKFIKNDEATRASFMSAFTGKRIVEIKKICWLKFNKQHGPFSILFLLIQTLILDHRLIPPATKSQHEHNKIISDRIKAIFIYPVDKDIILPKALDSTVAQYDLKAKSPRLKHQKELLEALKSFN